MLSGTLSNQDAAVVSQYYDMNRREVTTSYFQCYDILLAAGTNLITLRAKTDDGATISTIGVSLWPMPDARRGSHCMAYRRDAYQRQFIHSEGAFGRPGSYGSGHDYCIQRA